MLGRPKELPECLVELRLLRVVVVVPSMRVLFLVGRVHATDDRRREGGRGDGVSMHPLLCCAVKFV